MKNDAIAALLFAAMAAAYAVLWLQIVQVEQDWPVALFGLFVFVNMAVVACAAAAAYHAGRLARRIFERFS